MTIMIRGPVQTALPTASPPRSALDQHEPLACAVVSAKYVKGCRQASEDTERSGVPQRPLTY